MSFKCAICKIKKTGMWVLNAPYLQFKAGASVLNADADAIYITQCTCRKRNLRRITLHVHNLHVDVYTGIHTCLFTQTFAYMFPGELVCMGHNMNMPAWLCARVCAWVCWWRPFQYRVASNIGKGRSIECNAKVSAVAATHTHIFTGTAFHIKHTMLYAAQTA